MPTKIEIAGPASRTTAGEAPYRLEKRCGIDCTRATGPQRRVHHLVATARWVIVACAPHGEVGPAPPPRQTTRLLRLRNRLASAELETYLFAEISSSHIAWVPRRGLSPQPGERASPAAPRLRYCWQSSDGRPGVCVRLQRSRANWHPPLSLLGLYPCKQRPAAAPRSRLRATPKH
jgi:hypothetical protein